MAWGQQSQGPPTGIEQRPGGEVEFAAISLVAGAIRL